MAESVKYAKQAKESFEVNLHIRKGKKGLMFSPKYNSSEEAEDVQKKLTNYAISLHMIAKFFKGSKKPVEGKEFLNRALFVAENFLPSRNEKLIQTINADISEIQSEVKKLPVHQQEGDDADKVLTKLVNQTTSKKQIPSNRSARKSTRTSPGKRLAQSSSSERRDEPKSSKPPLASASKKTILSKRSNAQKSMQMAKAEDDTEMMHLSIYDDEKEFKSKQDEYIKQRIRDQNKSTLTRKPTNKSKVERLDELQSKNTVRSHAESAKVKQPRFNLAKQGAERDKLMKSQDRKLYNEDIEQTKQPPRYQIRSNL